MTEKYAKQLEIEKLNKAIIDNILNNVSAEDFIDFYIHHNQKETLEHFGLRTTKQLTKILKLFNYDCPLSPRLVQVRSVSAPTKELLLRQESCRHTGEFF